MAVAGYSFGSSSNISGDQLLHIVDDVNPYIAKTEIQSLRIIDGKLVHDYWVADPTGCGTRMLSHGGLTVEAYMEEKAGSAVHGAAHLLAESHEESVIRGYVDMANTMRQCSNKKQFLSLSLSLSLLPSKDQTPLLSL